MTLVLTGLSHKTAPVEVRERLAFASDTLPGELRAVVDGDVIREAMILSTCNRIELLVDVDPANIEEGKSRVTKSLLSRAPGAPANADRFIYTHVDREAVSHLFSVASSLDSMVLGEPQILGQVRRAYNTACETGTAGRKLHRVLHHAFHTAKRVRTETEIASSAVSLSYAAVELGRKILGALEGRTVLVIGAGEMAELSVRHLSKAGVSRILIANRTYETASRLASEFKGEAVPYERFPEYLAEADIVICSTGSRKHIITEKMARAALELRRNHPSFFIDISVPRNIDPKVGDVGNLFVFDVDDLESVVASNLREREREAVRAAAIVAAEVKEFEKALRGLEIGPTVVGIKERLRRVAQEEFNRQRSRLGNLSPEQERAVEQLLDSTVNKISHPLIQRLRRSFDTGDEHAVRAWSDSFGLAENVEVMASIRAELNTKMEFETAAA